MYSQSTTPYEPQNIDATTRMLVGLKASGKLAQYVAQNKDDPNLVALALSINKMGAALNAQQQPQQQPKVIDQVIAQMAQNEQPPMPPQGMGMPPMPPQGMPPGGPQGGPPQGMPPQGMPPQGMPPQGMPPGGPQGGPPPQGGPMPAGAAGGSVYDLPEEVGIGALPAKNIQNMADGGIVAFEEGGLTRDLTEQILASAKKYGIDPNVAMQLVKTESQFNPNAVNKKSGAAGLTQLMPKTAQEMGLKPEERFDTQKSLDAGFGYLNKLRNQFGGDYDKALAAYNWGPGNMQKHLTKNEGQINRVGLPKETADYLTKILPVGAAQAATATASESASGPTERNPQEPWYDRYRKLMTSGEGQRAMLQGVQDVPAALLGAPVDITTAAMRPFGYKDEKPMMGSKWLKEKLTNLGIREADSANPDLQTIRSGTEGIASLYNPLKTGVLQSRTAAEGAAARAEARAAEAKAAVETPRLAGPTTSTTMMQKPGYTPVINSEAKALEVADKERAIAEAARAELLRKEAAAAQAPSAFSSGINPVGALGAAATAAPGIESLMGGAGKGGAAPMRDDTYNPDVRMEPPKEDGGKGAPPAPAEGGGQGGIGSLFKDPMFLMGMHLLQSKDPRFMGALGESGIATAGHMAAQEKADAEAAYRAGMLKNAASDPLIKRLEALKDPETAKLYAKMKEMEREPMTREAMFKQFMSSPSAMTLKPEEIGPAFQNYVKSYESVMGPLGGLPSGVRVSRS